MYFLFVASDVYLFMSIKVYVCTCIYQQVFALQIPCQCVIFWFFRDIDN